MNTVKIILGAVVGLYVVAQIVFDLTRLFTGQPIFLPGALFIVCLGAAISLAFFRSAFVKKDTRKVEASTRKLD